MTLGLLETLGIRITVSFSFTFGTFHYSLSTSIREEGREGGEVKFKTPSVISVLVGKLCLVRAVGQTPILMIMLNFGVILKFTLMCPFLCYLEFQIK